MDNNKGHYIEKFNENENSQKNLIETYDGGPRKKFAIKSPYFN